MDEIDWKYRIVVGRPYIHSERVADLYASMTRKLAAIGAPWVPDSVLYHPLPFYEGRELMAASFKKGLHEPLLSFVLNISNRSRKRVLGPDEVFWGDSLIACYSSLKGEGTYKTFVESIFPAFVDAISAHNGCLYEEEVEDEDYDIYSESDDDAPPFEERGKVRRIWGANFWNAALCKSAFGRTPDEIVMRLRDEVAEVRIHRDGVLVIPSYDEPTIDEVRTLDGRLRPLLVG